ncbi:cubilin-like [Pollicipes pollicipes]|uniref:cubilin-like n=1 Tax=Pollicipes pollicipes TaxID=41117 RepID=UPI001884ADBE|nr:cubilin-like [Pollicipes pollicipes]
MFVYDGPDRSAPPLGEPVCGMDLPEPLVSSSNEVLVHFVNRPRYSGSRFKLRWQQLSQRPPPGDVAQSGFQLRVNTVDLFNYFQCTSDNITVYDGHQGTANWVPLATLCRRSEGGTTLAASGSLLKLEFAAMPFYRRHTQAGFNVTVDTVCGGFLTDPNGVVSSPGFPARHEGRLTCEWTLLVRPGRTILAEITDLDIPGDSSCPNGYVVVRRPPTKTTSGNAAFINYYTNATEPRMGFKARVSIATCGGTYYGRRGSLTISRNAYTTNRNCSYHIMGPSGHYMRLWFRTLDLESSPNCTRDYVEMRDFNSTGKAIPPEDCQQWVPEGRRIRLETADWQLPPAARSARGCRSWLTVRVGWNRRLVSHLNFTESAYFYCAPDAPPVINSTGNQMTIIFSSRVGSTSARGFRMRYSSNEPACEYRSCSSRMRQPACECHRCSTLRHSQAGCSPPGAPAGLTRWPFGSPAECRWQLTLPSVANASTLVTFNAFSLPDFGECLHLSLRVKPGEPWTSFFSLTYAVKPCGGLVSGPGQRIYSPGYPSDYPNGMDCAWLVEFEHQQTARIT